MFLIAGDLTMEWPKPKSYITDYTVVLRGNGKKQWVYQGDYYQCTADGPAWRRFRLMVPLLSLLEVALCAAASLVDPLSLRLGGVVYVLLPYAALAMVCLVGLFRTIHFCMLPRKIERMDYEKCIRPLRRYTLAISILSAATCLAQVVYILLNRAYAPGEWWAALFCAVSACLGFFSFRLQKRHPYENIGAAPAQGK